MCVCVLLGVTGAGYLPLFPDGVLSGGGVVLLQLPENLPLDHQHLQTGPILLFQGLTHSKNTHTSSHHILICCKGHLDKTCVSSLSNICVCMCRWSRCLSAQRKACPETWLSIWTRSRSRFWRVERGAQTRPCGAPCRLLGTKSPQWRRSAGKHTHTQKYTHNNI